MLVSVKALKKKTESESELKGRVKDVRPVTERRLERTVEIRANKLSAKFSGEVKSETDEKVFTKDLVDVNNV